MSGRQQKGRNQFSKDKAQDLVLTLLSEGRTIKGAMEEVGRTEAAFRQWEFTDPDFKTRAAQARLAGKGVKQDLADLKTISYEDFCGQFLDTQLFAHHLDWVDLLEGEEPRWLHPAMTFEKRNPNRVLINVPPEHAKSTVMTINYVTYRIVTNPNIRIVIVSKTQNMARKFLSAVKDRLTQPGWNKMQVAFGPKDGFKKDSTTWTADMIYLGTGRDSGEKDPTVEAKGMGSQIYGARADLIILDDVVMDTNAHEWEKQIEWIQKMVITRLGRYGKLLVVGTRVSANDLYRELRNGEHWSGGTSPFTYMAMPAVLEFDENPEQWKTLWPKTDRPEGEVDEPDADGLYPKWDGKSLYTRRGEVSSSTWAMVYQQEDVQEDAVFQPSCIAGSTNGMRKRGILKPGVPGHPKRTDGLYTIIGLDPAMAGRTAAVAISYNRADGKIYVLDCINMAEPTPQKIRSLMEEWVIKYRPQEMRIEINAHQKAYSLDDELKNWLAAYGCTLNGHFTGKNKWDTSFGVASMSNLFGETREGRFQDNNIIELPSLEGSEGLKSLTQQLITWKADTKGPTDCVMALWFAVIRARELMQQSNSSARYNYNRWVTHSQLEKRTSVNLDEMFHDQWVEYYN